MPVRRKRDAYGRFLPTGHARKQEEPFVILRDTKGGGYKVLIRATNTFVIGFRTRADAARAYGIGHRRAR